MKRLLTQSRALWTLAGLTLLLSVGFGVVMRVWDFHLIDEMYDPDQILAHISAMTQTQRTAHIWMTATLDVAYPFAYGGLFIGLAWRYFETIGHWLAMPSIAVIPVDLTEGAIQVLLLMGHGGVVGGKAIVTPLKLILFIFGLAVALIAVGKAITRRMRTQN